MPEGAEGEQPKKKFPLKMAIVLAAVMIVEGLAIGIAFWVAGGPSEVEATTAFDDPEAEENRPTILLVTSGKYQNTRSGQPFLYDTEIQVSVKNKHADLVQEKVTNLEPMISDRVVTIFRRAEPAHLNEPERQTLKRQLKATLNDILGNSPDGEPFVIEVLISNMKQFSTDI
ncbi:MAG: flagellar basal body-associated FliL family protein [Planctomycetota bacterium]